MTFLQIIVLSIIQGVTEFLPVSSKGHLLITEHLFGLNNGETNLLLIILLHLASLVAIVIFFYKDIIDMFRRNIKILIFVIIGTIPVGLVGFLFQHKIEALFTKPLVAGIGLVLTGGYMMLSEWHWKGTPQTLENASIWQVLKVGIAQVFALIPGISRSGTTLATGLLNGWEKQSAIKFSFLLALAAIAGATVLKFKDFGKLSVSFQPIPLLIGFCLCVAISLLSIWILVKIVRRGRLSIFAWYCLIIGLLVIIFVR